MRILRLASTMSVLSGLFLVTGLDSVDRVCEDIDKEDLMFCAKFGSRTDIHVF